MSAFPLVSIVLPVHNGNRFLDQAISSIVGQTFRDWELIVVDDDSTDESPAKIDAWAGRDARIQAVHLPENRKLPGALNEGFRHTLGQLLTWTSDDNWYAPEALARMTDVLAGRPEIDVVYAGYTIVDAEGRSLRTEPASPPDDLAVKNAVGACFLHRRKVLEKLGGYDEGLFLAEDYDFWLRASLHFRLEPLDETLYFYRHHERSLSSEQADVISRVTEPAIKRWLDQADWLTDRQRARAWEAMGLKALVRGDVAAGRRHLFRAIWLSRRLPHFHQCRTYIVDFLFGRRLGQWSRAWR